MSDLFGEKYVRTYTITHDDKGSRLDCYTNRVLVFSVPLSKGQLLKLAADCIRELRFD